MGGFNKNAQLIFFERRQWAALHLRSPPAVEAKGMQRKTGAEFKKCDLQIITLKQ